MLNKLFSPKAIAVIGASANKTKLGHSVLDNILKYKFKGRVYPVNPKAKKILGLKCYDSVLDIAGKVDLAIVIVPAKVVPDVLIACGQKKIPNVIIISAGFKEVGGPGIELEERVKNIAREFDMNLLGPNCLGVLDSTSNLNASFAEGMINKGRVAFFSQSGAICTAMLDWANLNGLGFSRFISLGNKAGITENEILKFLKNDTKTEIVLGYLEGVAEGRKFLEVCREVSKIKPIIILKAGKSAEAQKAISSHTGSLAGSDQVISAAFRQAGVIRADSLNDLFNYAKLFATQPMIKGNRVAVVANAGGPSVVTTDMISGGNLQLARFSDKTLKFLKKNLPSTAAINNPVDVIGDALADRYQVALDAVLADKKVDGVIVLLTPQTVTEINKTAEVIVSLNQKYQKPVVASFIGGQKVKSGVEILEASGVPTYNYPEQAVAALAAMAEYQKVRRLKGLPVEMRAINLKIWKKVGRILNSSKKQVEWTKAEEILKNYQIPLVKSGVAKDAKQAVRLAKRLGYPAAMKVISPRLIHKTYAGGVLVNLETPEEVVEGFKKLIRVAKKFKGQILIQSMVKDAKEIIIGVKRDPQFGPVVMFGLGGVYVEILKDVTFRVAPITLKEAEKMISEIKASDLLKGTRGEKGVNLKAIANILVKLSQLAIDFPQIKEMEVNPAMATSKGCEVVDVRIMV